MAGTAARSHRHRRPDGRAPAAPAHVADADADVRDGRASSDWNRYVTRPPSAAGRCCRSTRPRTKDGGAPAATTAPRCRASSRRPTAPDADVYARARREAEQSTWNPLPPAADSPPRAGAGTPARSTRCGARQRNRHENQPKRACIFSSSRVRSLGTPHGQTAVVGDRVERHRGGRPRQRPQERRLEQPGEERERLAYRHRLPAHRRRHVEWRRAITLLRYPAGATMSLSSTPTTSNGPARRKSPAW